MTAGSGMPESSARALRLVRLGWSEEYSGAQAVVAAVVAVAPAAYLVCLLLAAPGLSWWFVVLAPVGLTLVSRTGSPLTLVVWAALGYLWVLLVPGPFTWWCVPAALMVLLSHTASTLLAGRPTIGGFSAEAPRRTARRVGLVALATVGVAAVARASLAIGVAGEAAVIVVALVVLSAWWLWGARRQV